MILLALDGVEGSSVASGAVDADVVLSDNVVVVGDEFRPKDAYNVEPFIKLLRIFFVKCTHDLQIAINIANQSLKLRYSWYNLVIVRNSKGGVDATYV